MRRAPRPPSCRCPWSSSAARSCLEDSRHQEHDIDAHRHRGDDPRRAHGALAGARLLVVHRGALISHGASVTGDRRRQSKSPWARSPSLITGGVLKVWCGAGDGTVHSRPRAASHTRSVAFAPLRSDEYRIANIMNGVRNMPNAPIELTMFQSANTTL